MNQDTEQFLTYFPTEYVALAYFDKESSKILPGCSYVYDRKEKLIKELSELKVLPSGRAGGDITAHILVNESDGKGRKKENITACHTFFCDLDRWINREELSEIISIYQPQMIVQSSLSQDENGTKIGKFHFYWRCDSTLSLARWSVYQKGINAILKSPEPTPGAITHMLRVPGFERVQKTGEVFTPKLVYLEENAEPIDPKKVFPGVVKAATQVERKEKRERKEIAEIDISSLTEINFEVGSRNKTMFSALFTLVKRGKVSSVTDLKHAGKTINDNIPYEVLSSGRTQVVGGPLDTEELNGIVKSAWERGSKAFKKEQRKMEIAKGEGQKMLGDITPDVEKETLDKLKVVAEKQYVNGKSHDYPYVLTGVNIQDPFNTPAIMERFFYRYGHLVCRSELGKKGFRVFHPFKKVWIKQEESHCPWVTHYLDEMRQELVMTESFINVFGRKNGDLHEPTLTRNRERFLSVKMRKDILSSIFNSPDVREVLEKDFDANPEIFFCANGVLNLLTGELQEVKSTDYLLNRSPVLWDSGADTTEWQNFIKTIFEKNIYPEQTTDFMQELFGYSLSGNMSSQAVFCHYGTAANGKSTLLRVLAKISGDYAVKIAPDSMSARGDAKFERLAVRAVGKRCCIIDDIDTEFAFNEAFIKNITDTEIEGRYLTKEHFTLQNRAKFHMGLNALPESKSNVQSQGYFRRIKITHYNQEFEANEDTGKYVDDLINRNLSAILKWAVIGYQRYISQGKFTYCKDSQVIEQEYRQESGGITTELLFDLFEKGDAENYMLCSDVIKLIEDSFEHTLRLNRLVISNWVRKAFGVESFQKKIGGKNCKCYPIKRKVSEVEPELPNNVL